jgi:hypothetical protein
LQGALLDTNPEPLEQQAQILEIPSADVERAYLLLNEFNTRLSAHQRSLLEEECAPLLAGRLLANPEVQAAIARIDAEEPREEILQDVLQNVRDTFGDDVVRRMQRRVDQISGSGRFLRIQGIERMVRQQSGGDLGYLKEQCAVVQE